MAQLGRYQKKIVLSANFRATIPRPMREMLGIDIGSPLLVSFNPNCETPCIEIVKAPVKSEKPVEKELQ